MIKSVFRFAWFVLALFGLSIASDYTAQQRYMTVGFCPAAGGVPGILVLDMRNLAAGCLALPAPSKDELAPQVPKDDKKTES